MAIESLQAKIDAVKPNGTDAPPWEIPPAESYGEERGSDQREGDKRRSAAKIEPFPVAPLDEISEDVTPQTVQNVFAKASVGVIAGSPNTGKTFLAVHLGIHLAANAPWFGCKVSGGPVLYVAAEAPGSVKTRARIAASTAFGKQRLPFYVVTAAPGLGSEIDSPGDTDRLLATAAIVESTEGSKIQLIVIDTVASVLADGEENADGMLRLAGAAKYMAVKTGATVVLIHHPSKGDPTSLRGHSSLSAAVDTIMSISTDDNTGVRTATLVKSRDSAAGRQFFFSLDVVTLATPDSFGDPRTSCVVRPVDVPISQRRRPGGKAQEQLLAELERRYRANDTHWDEASIRKAGQGVGMHRNSIPKALKGLLASGFVVGQPSHMTLKYPPEDAS